jgi:apolipoprotein N-acyltransferase
VQGPKGSTGNLQFALLQDNTPQDEKFIPGGGIEPAPLVGIAFAMGRRQR